MDEATPKRETIDRIKNILRRDLMLGDDVDIEDDRALIGGDLDLDSLDALLIVTNVEKELGIKIPNEDVGRDIFESVSSLALFIDRYQKEQQV